MTLDELIRLANYAGGTASDAQARGVSPAVGPPAVRATAPLQAAAPVAQPPGMPVPSLGDAVMGPAGPLEHLAGNLPGNSIAGLLDMAGTILRGHSAYGDVRKRAALNAYGETLPEAHYDARAEREKAQATADRAVRTERIGQLQNRIDKALTRRAALVDAANVPGHAPESLTSYKNEVADLDAQLPKWTAALARLTGEESLSAAPSPLALPEKPIQEDFSASARKVAADTAARVNTENALKPPAEETDYSGQYDSDGYGGHYLNLAKVPAKDRPAAQAAAAKSGARVLTPDESKAIEAIKQTKDNIELMGAKIDRLPKGAFSIQRVINAYSGEFDTDLSQLNQSIDAAFGAAKAVSGGGGGMRASRDLIQMTQRANTPAKGDYQERARNKLATLAKYADNAARAILGDERVPRAAEPSRPNPTAPLTGRKRRPPLSSFVKGR